VERGDTDVAFALIELACELDLRPNLDRAQELAYERLQRGEGDESWRALATALNLALPSPERPDPDAIDMRHD
jgi:hypothetical protein